MRRLGAALLLVAVAAGSPVQAQRLSGRLVDLVSHQPIPHGLIILMSADGGPSRMVLSDAQGFWSFQVPAPGAYYVAAKRLGYQPWISGPVHIGPSDDLASVFHLRPLPVVLEPVEVSAAAVRHYLELTGFYQRQKSDFGRFLTPEYIAKRRATRITDLLSGLPGVRVVPMHTGSVGPQFVQLRGGAWSGGQLCRPRVFVDGLLFARGDSRPVRTSDDDPAERLEEQWQRMDQALSLDDIGPPSTIAAIEVYSTASQVPVQFGGTSVETLCGVIVIWTRTGLMGFGR